MFHGNKPKEAHCIEMKEVYFNEYCNKCMYKDIREEDEPCSECVETSAREESHKPILFKEEIR